MKKMRRLSEVLAEGGRFEYKHLRILEIRSERTELTPLSTGGGAYEVTFRNYRCFGSALRRPYHDAGTS
jgi:hypothetical protein